MQGNSCKLSVKTIYKKNLRSKYTKKEKKNQEEEVLAERRKALADFAD
jgi:hypothetical protein